jgi:hypothetical protein
MNSFRKFLIIFLIKRGNVVRYSAGGGTLIRHYGFIKAFRTGVDQICFDGWIRS